jgi:hypothetical protein
VTTQSKERKLAAIMFTDMVGLCHTTFIEKQIPPALIVGWSRGDPRFEQIVASPALKKPLR